MTAQSSSGASSKSSSDLSGRLLVETLLYGFGVLAMALVVLALWVADRPLSYAEATSETLTEAVDSWLMMPPERVGIVLSDLPDQGTRDKLALLRALGTDITWRADDGFAVPALSLSLDPVADPRGRAVAWTTGTTSAHLLKEVFAGDTLQPAQITAQSDALDTEVTVRRLSTRPDALILTQEHTEAAEASLQQDYEFKPLLVLGDATWEMRFLVAALEEYGWDVEAYSTLSESQIVGLMPEERIDPRGAGRGTAPEAPGSRFGVQPRPERGAARGETRGERGAPPHAEAAAEGQTKIEISAQNYAAVIAIDAAAARYASQIDSYVRDGGGLLLFPDAAKAPEFTALRMADSFGAVREARAYLTEDETEDLRLEDPRLRLELHVLDDLKDGSSVVEARAGETALVIGRLGDGARAGRVLQSGYRDLWRWGMAAPQEDAPLDYRQWLADSVALIATLPLKETERSFDQVIGSDPAPLAAWEARMGPAQSVEGGQVSLQNRIIHYLAQERSLKWLFGLALTGFALAWFSRRMRQLS